MVRYITEDLMQSSIETPKGLADAIWDIIHDEPELKTFTRTQMLRRLPYGKRVENAIDRLYTKGDIVRIAPGLYRAAR